MKRKRLSFFLILIFVVISFFVFDGFSFRTKLLTALNIPTSSTRTENYDKLKIDILKITERLTGTEPFNKEANVSNVDGVDVSPDDNYIRTNDFINYTLEVRISGTNQYEDKSGGIIKIKGSMLNQGNPVLMVFEEQAWMKNTVFNEDKTEIYTEYHFADGQTPIGNQTMTFTVKVLGYKKNITEVMKPTFEVWMEGNKPDNSSSSISSKTIKDSNPIIISGHPSYDIALSPSSLIQNDTYQGKRGSYYSFSVGVSLKQDVNSFSDLRGIEYPHGSFDIDLELAYKYKDVSNSVDYQVINAETPRANGLANGTSLITHSLNCDYSAPGYYPANRLHVHGHNLPAGRIGMDSPVERSVQNSGDFSTTISDNKIHLTFDNFVINGIFPELGAANYSYTGSNTGYFAVGNIELFSPYYDDDSNISYDYTVEVKAIKANYKTQTISSGSISTADNGYIADVQLGNNSLSFGMSKRVAGNLYMHVGTNLADYRRADASIYDGREFTTWVQNDVMDGPYLGGSDNLLFWNPNIFEIIPYSEGKWYSISQNNLYGNPDYNTDSIEYRLGVYKQKPWIGLADENKMQKAVYEDFDWYTNYDEATRHGKVTAFYLSFPENQGYGIRYTFKNRFISHVTSDLFGKTTMMFGKSRVFSDANRQTVYEYGGDNYYHNDSVYHKTVYNEEGLLVTNETPNHLGETYLMIGYMASVETSSTDLNNNNTVKTIYDVQDGVINLKVTPNIVNGKPITSNDEIIDTVTIETTLPKGLTYRTGTANKTPDQVIYDPDSGTTKIIWTYHGYQVNHEPPQYRNLLFQAVLSLDLLNNQQLEIQSVISCEGDSRDAEKFRTGLFGITIVNLAGSKGIKYLDPSVIDINGNFKVETKIGNTSSSNLMNVQTVEVLPKNNDGSSSFGGSYTAKVTYLSSNEKMYYTTLPISEAGIYKDSTGIYVTTGVNYSTDSRWIEVSLNGTIPSNATAIGSTIPKIASKDSASHEIQFFTNGNYAKDYYAFVSSFTSDNLETSVRTNKVICYVRDYIIRGMVFKDQQNNNIYDSRGDSKLSNITVKLYNERGTLIKTTMTDSEGRYSFDYLTKQKYYVKFEVDPGNHLYEVVLKNQGAEDVSSVSNTNYQTDLITFAGNEREVIVDNINLGIKEKFKVTTRVNGSGGTIQGDEVVYQGTDSTPNKIVATANDGFYISKIEINGVEIPITNKHSMIVDYFRSIQENKNVVVTFQPNRLLIDKVNEENEKLVCVTFHLVQGNTVTHSCVSTLQGCEMKQIKAGRYQLKEVAVPAGYALSTTVYDVTVDGNGYLSISGETSDVEITKTILNRKNQLLIEKVNENQQFLEGATLGLFQENDKKYECRSTSSGCLIQGIVPGSYVLKEISVPAGYALQQNTYSVVVGSNGYINVNGDQFAAEKRFRFENRPNKLTIHKVEEENIPLKGAILGLFQNNQEKYRCTSQENGNCVITKIVPGEYTLKEIYNPDGYVLSRDTQMVVVSVDGWISVNASTKKMEASTNFMNTPTKIELYLREGVDAYPITGDRVQLLIEGPNDYRKVLTLKEAKGYLLSHLKRGNYTVTQLGTDSEYINSHDKMTFQVRSDGLVITNGRLQNVYTYINYPKPKMKLVKKDSKTNEIISGATLELKNIDTGEVREFSVGVEEITFDEGKYEIREISPKEHYIHSKEVVSIEVLNNGDLYVNGEMVSSGYEYSYYNSPMPKFKVIKKDYDTRENLEGVQLELSRLDRVEKIQFLAGSREFLLDEGEYQLKEVSTLDDYILSKEIVLIQVDENGNLYVNHELKEDGYLYEFLNHKKPKVKFTKKDLETDERIENSKFQIKNISKNTTEEFIIGQKLISFDEGEYEIREILPTNGYIMDTRSVRVQVDNNGILKVDDAIREDSYEVVFKNQMNSLKIRKVDEEMENVSGAIIGIFQGEEEVERIVTGEEESTIRGLKRGVYTVREIKSPKNYIKSEDSYQIQVTKNGIDPGEVVICNILMPKVVIQKKNSDNGEVVVGAKMVIEDENNQVVGFFESKKDAYSIHLPYGNYSLREEEAPKGYVKSDEKVEFSLSRESEKETTIEFLNEPTYSILIRKVGDDGKGIDGAVFQIEDSEGKMIRDSIVSKVDGIEVEGLEKGNYILKEIKPADGFYLNSEEIPFTIRKNASIKEIKVVNEHIPIPNTFDKNKKYFLYILCTILILSGGMVLLKTRKIKEIKE